MENSENPQYDSKGRLIKVGRDLRHIAFIMDGNGRWAQRRGYPREKGHTEGTKAFERAVRYCGEIGLEVMTVYAFSTENWKRPEREVRKIMGLLEKYLDKLLEKASEYEVKVRFIGERKALSQRIRDKISLAEDLTSGYHRVLNIALNYGGRAEITSAVNRLISAGRRTVSEDDISGALYTSGLPDPDLIVRTAGERRLSNFLLWQSSYSEFYYTDTLWPDMDETEIQKAIDDYYNRTRRFGAVR